MQASRFLYLRAGRAIVKCLAFGFGAIVLMAAGQAHAVIINIGDILVANKLGGIIRVDPGGRQSLVASGGLLQAPEKLVLDGASILVTDTSADAVIRVNPVTGQQSLVASGGLLGGRGGPQGIAVDRSGNILVTQRDQVIQVDPRTGAQTVLSSPSPRLDFSLNDIVLNAVGDIFVSDGTNGRILKVDPASGIQTVVASALDPAALLSFPRGITLDRRDDILVAESSIVKPNGIIRVAPATGSQTPVSLGGLFGPASQAVVTDVVGALRQYFCVASESDDNKRNHPGKSNNRGSGSFLFK